VRAKAAATLAFLVLAAAASPVAQAAPAGAARDAATPKRSRAAEAARREVRARALYAEGHYDEAVTLFADLFAETLHPTYLRNIGRCYQNLGQAQSAIRSFRDYLRKAGNIPDKERKEVEGYIAEMEVLQAKDEKTAAEKKPASFVESDKRAAVSPPLPAAAHVALAEPAPVVLLNTAPAAAVAEPAKSHAWLYGSLAAVVVAGAVGAFFVLRPHDSDPACASPRVCQ
jgi:tetratricopeptide (TPR) repeat protein